jgi:hypothetical protein
MALFKQQDRRRRPQSEATEPPAGPEPPPAEQSAEQRLVELLAEQGKIERELTEHREQRQRWLTDGGPIDRVAKLAEGDDRLRLRAEQLTALLPAAQAAVRQEQAAARQAHWHGLMPDLEAAMLDTANAIRAFSEAAERYRRLHWHAVQSGYEAEFRERFVTPPHQQVNPWVMEQFAAAVERRGQPHAVIEATIIPAPSLGLGVLRDPWKPLHGGRVPPDLIEAISALAPARQVRFLHRVNIFRVAPGYTVVEAGTELWLNARAAFACCYIGAAVEVEQPAEAPAA